MNVNRTVAVLVFLLFSAALALQLGHYAHCDHGHEQDGRNCLICKTIMSLLSLGVAALLLYFVRLLTIRDQDKKARVWFLPFEQSCRAPPRNLLSRV